MGSNLCPTNNLVSLSVISMIFIVITDTVLVIISDYLKHTEADAPGNPVLPIHVIRVTLLVAKLFIRHAPLLGEKICNRAWY